MALDDFFGVLKNTISSALPKCDYCDAPSLMMPCLSCGALVCKDHGFFSTGRQAVCDECVETLAVIVERTKKQKAPSESKEEKGYPWSVLGLEPGASTAEINQKFRELSKGVHPDQGGTEAEFKRLNTARIEALRLARGRR